MTKTNNDILVYDIETAGVNAFNADLGYVITFGYIWLEDYKKGKKWKTISIGDFPLFKKDPHDDTELLKAAREILLKAKGIIHHYGNKFDAPFLLTRLMIKKLPPMPELPMLDTCFLAYKRMKLSSNRLINVAKVLKCKWQKLDKKDGWPLWWMAYLKGDLRYDKAMRKYCGYDVMTLAEISERMRPFWPPAFVNKIFTKGRWCSKCGSNDLLSKGRVIMGRILRRKLVCTNPKCGFTGNYENL